MQKKRTRFLKKLKMSLLFFEKGESSMTKNKNFNKKLKQSIVLLMSLAMIAANAGSVFASEEAVVDTEGITTEEAIKDTEVVKDTEITIEGTEDVEEETSEEETSENEEGVFEETEHTFGDWTVTKEATYKETGIQERSCTGCGYTETQEIEKIAHEHVASNLSFSDTGHSWTCKYCGEVYNAGPHEYGEWEYINETSNGSTKYMRHTCKCGYKEEKEVSVGTVITSVDVTITEPVIGEHPDFNPTIVTDPATEDIKLAYVTWFKYDPDNTNYCLGLLKETDVFEEGYVYGVWIQYNTYQTSTIFGGSTGVAFTLNAEAPTNNPFNTWERISYSVKFDKLEAHTHEYVYESTEDGHYQVCKCGDETEVEEHTFGDWTVTKEATYKKTGLQERTCTVCGYTETQEIEKIAHEHIAYGSVQSETQHGTICKLCGDKYNLEDHTYGDWEYINETSNGSTKYMQRTCKCGKKEKKTIDVVTVDALNIQLIEPVIGEHPDFNPVITVSPTECKANFAYIHWHKYDASNNYIGLLKESDVFEAGYCYKASIQVNLYQTNEIFTSATKFTLNDEELTESLFNTWERITVNYMCDVLEEHVHEYTYESTEDGHYQVCECGDVKETEEHSFESWKSAGNGKQSRICSVCGYTETQNTSTIIMNSIFDFFKNIFGFGSRSSGMMTNITNNKAENSIFSKSSVINTTRINNMRNGRTR